MPDVNPEILKWARETAGFLSVDDAARALGIGSAKGLTGGERLAAMENGEPVPRSILIKMTEKYRRPLLVFYLADVPKTGDRGRDFRTRPGGVPLAYNPKLDALIRDIRARHDTLRSAMADEESDAVTYVGSASGVTDAAILARMIQEATGFERSVFRRQKSRGDAFKYLRSKIEQSGTFVLLAGNLGSHHSNISPDDFGGYAIADDIAPFIVVNDQDSRSAWSFTALHEFAHILLGATGISNDLPTTAIELLCNGAASAILLPEGDLEGLDDIRTLPLEDQERRITNFANSRNLSCTHVALRLLKRGAISQARYDELAAEYKRQWFKYHREMGEPEESSGDSKPTFYITKRHRLGPALLAIVKGYLADGVLSQIKAGRVLGVKPRNLEPLLSDLGKVAQG